MYGIIHISDLVTTCLTMFNRAIQSRQPEEFYTHFFSRSFKDQYTPEQLQEGFQDFFEKKIDLSGIKFFPPLFLKKPQVENEVLDLEGFYLLIPPGLPNILHFHFEFAFEDGLWKILSIHLKSVTEETMPDTLKLLLLIEGTLLNFNESIKRQDFRSFWKTISPSFQEKVSVEDFTQAFREFLQSSINFLGIKNVLPVFKKLPEINPEGHLAVSGVYYMKTYPEELSFSMEFEEPSPGNWKLYALQLNAK